jgi:hypothetical protein
MRTRLWLSGRCFECQVERIAPAGDGWVVKTRARRYFRFDTASVTLLRKVMAVDAPNLDDLVHAQVAAFVERRLIPLGIYCSVDDAVVSSDVHTTTGTMRWQRQLLAARRVRPIAAALATLFSPWLLLPLLALCLWLHASHALDGSTQLAYRDLLSYTPNELLLLVAVAVGRGLLHEFGHAAACWRLTGSVGAIGYGVFMATPVLYCDVSDIHLLPRCKKALVGLAGTAMDIVALALLLALGGAELSVVKVYWLSMIAVLLNLLPFYRNDGYWVLNDLAGSSDLLKQSLHACLSGKGRVSDWAVLAFMATCVAGIAALGIAFAVEFGPQQIAEAMLLRPSFAGAVLVLVTALQYGALVFAIFGAVKTLQRAARGFIPSTSSDQRV